MFSQYYGLPEEIRHSQISIYYCPSQRGPQLSVTCDDRNGSLPQTSGACADYAMNGGDGEFWPHYLGGNGGNGVAFPTHNYDLTPSGYFTGSSPNLVYHEWKIQKEFRQVKDGLSKTLLAGEKHVHPDHWGEGCEWGDSSRMNDDSFAVCTRLAGPGYPLASNPTDPTIPSFDHNARFGSSHPGGVCQFAMCDGSVRSITPDIDTVELGHLAHINDGN